MDSGTNNSIPTVFCQRTQLLGPQVSAFLDLALGYNKAPQQATSQPFKWSPLNMAFLHMHSGKGSANYLSSLSLALLLKRYIYVYMSEAVMMTMLNWTSKAEFHRRISKSYSFITFHSSTCNEWADSLKNNLHIQKTQYELFSHFPTFSVISENQGYFHFSVCFYSYFPHPRFGQRCKKCCCSLGIKSIFPDFILFYYFFKTHATFTNINLGLPVCYLHPKSKNRNIPII